MGELMHDERRYLAIEIGGTKLQMVIGNGEGRILRRWRAAVERREGGPGICRQIERGVVELTKDTRIEAVGVGFGGPVDWRTGRICCSHQIAGWENFELATWLQELTGVAVAVENDANVATLGETLSGAGRGANPLFYSNMGSGVGGGMTVDGRIYHGQVPGECEFGHVRLDRSGTTVESRCSGWAVDERIRRRCAERPGSVLGQLIGSTRGGEAKHLSAALAQGDPIAREILAEVGDDLGLAFSHVVHLLHPERIVLGGGLSLVGEPLRAAVAAAIPRYLMKAFLPGPQVHLAGLGEDVVPVGALHLARMVERS
ncbi:MAG: ROK family protein [Bacillota bacterium]